MATVPGMMMSNKEMKGMACATAPKAKKQSKKKKPGTKMKRSN